VAEASPTAAMVTQPTAQTGAQTGLPVTGSGAAVDLWLIVVLAALLIVAGALALRRRTA
jgi:hypothetical protein